VKWIRKISLSGAFAFLIFTFNVSAQSAKVNTFLQTFSPAKKISLFNSANNKQKSAIYLQNLNQTATQTTSRKQTQQTQTNQQTGTETQQTNTQPATSQSANGTATQTASNTQTRQTQTVSRQTKFKAKQIIRALKLRYGENLKCSVYYEHNVIFASDLKPQRLNQLRTLLIKYLAFQRNYLFPHRFSSFVKLVIVSRAKIREILGKHNIGMYYNQDKIFFAIGSEGVILHEFTHCLHFNDMQLRKNYHRMWLVEGLATLFEASVVKGDKFIPKFNNRLASVKKALKENKLPPLKTLFALNYKQFYSKDKKLHYAESRALLFWLFELKKLKNFYANYCKCKKSKASDEKALEMTLNKKLSAIETDFVNWLRKKLSLQTQSQKK